MWRSPALCEVFQPGRAGSAQDLGEEALGRSHRMEASKVQAEGTAGKGEVNQPGLCRVL